MGFKGKQRPGKFKPKKKNGPKTRRDLRKEKRQEKKSKRRQHMFNKSNQGKERMLPVQVEEEEIPSDVEDEENEDHVLPSEPKTKEVKTGLEKKPLKKKKKDDDEKNLMDFQKEKVKLEMDMEKRRIEQLREANEEEDRNIKSLEKLMKMNKRKSKKLPKAFVDEGLDYLLEVCDPTRLSAMQKTPDLLESDSDEFDEDFAEVTGERPKKEKNKAQPKSEDKSEEMSGEECDEEEDDEEEDDEEESVADEEEDEEFGSMEEDFSEGELEEEMPASPKSEKAQKRVKFADEEETQAKKVKIDDAPDEDGEEDEAEKEEETWEDIYGRIRDKKGNVLQGVQGKYIPPALRASTTDSVKLARLKRQMQGLLNRVAESNMASVASQMEQIILSNSRGDANQVLVQLLHALAPAGAVTPARMIAEHALLLAILHAHIGAEVGAAFLQSTVEKFDECYLSKKEVEDKTLNNLLQILCFMYCFKMFHCTLLFDILDRFGNSFEEKDVELILLVLKTVGPSLRKDDPAALKNVIIQLQKQASSCKAENSRVAFMMDILLAIKNNNMSKIPDYDPDLVDRLRKLLRALLRSGSSVSELKISLKDLLNAQKQGKWWVVGSAWQGAGPGEKSTSTTTNSSEFSQKLLELARKQRMNTDLRRNVFCILMSAEDFIDAFEKVLHLGVKGQQEREIPYVILHCCLQEQTFNAYYAHISQKFCDYDRRFKMSIQCSIWDKIKELDTMTKSQIRNLASFTSFLVLNGGLTLAVLKVIEFSDLDKVHVKFIRQVLLKLLLTSKEEECIGAFTRVPSSPQLALFKEGMRLFLHRYILGSSKAASENKLLKDRVPKAERAFIHPDSKVRF
ncbi:nucleolar MIF4G domain-containing protein 1 homolog [Cloeon dipterum]|uniref:nucleolar MIF4G domain-containing protein 1 homolog n=1 Tax=Cloeon dipterum TaxID=197152 RepID=UPI00321FC17A